MKCKLIFVIIFLPLILLAQSNKYFTELSGLEDSTGNTHLFYRMFLTKGADSTLETEHSVYHFDINNDVDTLFIKEYTQSIPYEHYIIEDLDFFSSPLRFIYCGNIYAMGSGSFIKRIEPLHMYLWGYPLVEFQRIAISRNNPDLVYAANPAQLIKSIDGGKTWPLHKYPQGFTDFKEFALVSLNKFNDKILYGLKYIYNKYVLIKSLDSGNTYTVVDTNGWSQKAKFNYDIDGNHIYTLNRNNIFLSTNKGDTWTTIISDTQNLSLTINELNSGEIYYSRGKIIYLSQNHGASFEQFKILTEDIVGIYKKPNSNKLYAATSTDIYEITPTSITVIKTITSVDENIDTPNKFVLYQNYPNPFNSISNIKFIIAKLSHVTLKVYDILGREVATLVDEKKPPGEYEVEFDGAKLRFALQSGVYFYQLKTGDYIETKKMIYLK